MTNPNTVLESDEVLMTEYVRPHGNRVDHVMKIGPSDADIVKVNDWKLSFEMTSETIGAFYIDCGCKVADSETADPDEHLFFVHGSNSLEKAFADAVVDVMLYMSDRPFYRGPKM